MTTVLPPGLRDPALFQVSNPVINDVVTFDHYARQFKDKPWSQATLVMKKNGGPPLHYHKRIRESFTCREGKLGIHIDGKDMTLLPGESATVEPGKMHLIFNDTGKRVSAELKTECGDANASYEFKVALCEGFEKTMYIAYGLARDGRVNGGGIPRDPRVLAALMQLGDVWLPGLMGSVVGGMMSVLLAAGNVFGVKASLERRYWENYAG